MIQCWEFLSFIKPLLLLKLQRSGMTAYIHNPPFLTLVLSGPKLPAQLKAETCVSNMQVLPKPPAAPPSH